MWTGVLPFDRLVTATAYDSFADDPVITSFSPTFGGAGTTVVLTGSNFTGTSVVALGSLAATFVVNSATQITATVPVGATDAPWYVITPLGVGSSTTVFDVTNAVGASTKTLRWALDVYPADQPTSTTRVLLRESRNAIVIRDVIDVESDTYATPSAVSWSLRDDAEPVVSGSCAIGPSGWRGEIALDPNTPLGSGLTLAVTATLGAASWTRDYPITVTDAA